MRMAHMSWPGLQADRPRTRQPLANLGLRRGPRHPDIVAEAPHWKRLCVAHQASLTSRAQFLKPRWYLTLYGSAKPGLNCIVFGQVVGSRLSCSARRIILDCTRHVRDTDVPPTESGPLPDDAQLPWWLVFAARQGGRPACPDALSLFEVRARGVRKLVSSPFGQQTCGSLAGIGCAG